MKHLATALAACLIALPALAFDGRYGENCAPDADRGPIEIRDGRIIFYEVQCDLTNPVNVRDLEGAVLFDFVCAGEGQNWTERALLQPSHDGGLILLWRGLSSMLPACP